MDCQDILENQSKFKKMSDHEFHEFIKNGQFVKAVAFNASEDNLQRLVEYIRQLPAEESSFDIMGGLMKFYGFPILIYFRNLYEKAKKQNISESIEEKIKNNAAFIKNYLNGKKFEELSFLFSFGLSKKKSQMGPRSKQQKQYIQYIEKLSSSLTELRKNQGKMKADEIKHEIDNIMSDGMERKTHFLEKYHENYLKKEAKKLHQQKEKQQAENQKQKVESPKKSLELRPQKSDQPINLICCRTFFIDGEQIKEPENLVLQYKNYRIPFDEKRTSILKKTFCGFLNGDGGIIFIGIHEDVMTKKRIVNGIYLNEQQKQSCLKSFRRIADQIQPSILVNKMYEVKFVPIKINRSNKSKYISGKFVIKIIIKYGQRDEIYSYQDNGKDYFAFRTENQVIHREGRSILDALRERIKNPLPIPHPLHSGPCKNPELGRPIYDKIPVEHYQQYGSSNRQDRKMKFKEKDASDYIVIGLSQSQMQQSLKKKKLSEFVKISKSLKSEKICFLKCLKKQTGLQIYLVSLIDLGVQVIAIGRGFKINSQQVDPFMIFDALKEKKIGFKFDKQENTFKFQTSDDAISAYLTFHEFQVKVQFIQI